MIWFRRRDPLPSPPAPEHVDIEALMLAATDETMPHVSSVEMAYIRANAPRQSVDKWEQPLPLSIVDQDRIDRMFALLTDPISRGRALLISGDLIPEEVEALRYTNPDVLLSLQQHAQFEMATHGPPFAAWAETVLGYLFEKPAATVDASPQQDGGGGGKPEGPEASGLPTPVDRLDPAVRKQTQRS